MCVSHPGHMLNHLCSFLKHFDVSKALFPLMKKRTMRMCSLRVGSKLLPFISASLVAGSVLPFLTWMTIAFKQWKSYLRGEGRSGAREEGPQAGFPPTCLGVGRDRTGVIMKP